MPTADYNSPYKEALAHYLPDMFALFFPDVHAQIDWSRGYVLLDKELQQVTRDADLGRRLADALVQVWGLSGGVGLSCCEAARLERTAGRAGDKPECLRRGRLGPPHGAGDPRGCRVEMCSLTNPQPML